MALPRSPAAVTLALALALLAQAAATPARAEEPVLFGRKDFEMDWRQEPGGRILRVRFLGAARKLRIEALDGSEQAILRDLASGEVRVLVAEGRKGVFGGKARPMGAFRPDSVGETRSVAGEPCREVTTGGARLCVSDDGIPLEVAFEGGSLRAERVVRQAQHPALFSAPKDVPVKPVPGSANGMLPF